MSSAQPITFAEAARLWFKIGCLGFGGPAGQIALLHKLVVDEKKWASETQFLHALNYCMLLPGPEAQQLATYLGWLLHGPKGGLAAGTLFILPGFVVIAALSMLYAAFGATSWLGGAFLGLQCAVIALVIEALARVAKRALRSRAAHGIAGAAFIGLFVFQIPFPLIILAAAGLGLIWLRTSEAGASDADRVPARSLRADLPRLARTTLLGCALWLGPIAFLAWLLGPGDLFVAMGLFFAKMAIVTFGGAYAVLTYVAQEVVHYHAWIGPRAMIDGLALAETTPGPLILVLSFVGFQAAYAGAGGEWPMLIGLLGAIYVTWITFVPSFLWIFLGAPYVERLRANRKLSAALAGVTAAVVGVIGSLALWFGLHVLFAATFAAAPFGTLLPDPGSLRWPALLLTIVAALALLRWRLGLTKTLLGSVALGYPLAMLAG